MFRKIIPLSILLFFSCTSNVERIEKRIDNQFDDQLSNDLRTVVSTLRFIQYGHPEMYWYPIGTTGKQIIEDEFNYGYQQLGKLDGLISQIQSNNIATSSAVDTLHNRIIVAQQKIEKAKKDLEQVNSLFGFGLIGGASTLYDMANLFSPKTQNNDGKIELPKEVAEAFDNLVEQVCNDIGAFIDKTHDFEVSAIGSNKIDDQEKMIIRSYLNSTIRERAKLYSTDTDTIIRNDCLERLPFMLDGLYPPLGTKN